MKLNFTKWQGCGNDFVMIDCLETSLGRDYASLGRELCDRHYGIGADGILVAEPSDKADFRMRIINADGSEVLHVISMITSVRKRQNSPWKQEQAFWCRACSWKVVWLQASWWIWDSQSLRAIRFLSRVLAAAGSSMSLWKLKVRNIR